MAFTAEERAAIETAHDWVCSHRNQSCPPIVWDRSPEDRRPGTIAKTTAGPGGFCDGKTGVIYLDAPERLKALAAHEFGHWAGLPHTRDGFMAPVIVTDDLQWPSDL
jgi:hypothetical protein